jgi:hypothetical protein
MTEKHPLFRQAPRLARYLALIGYGGGPLFSKTPLEDVDGAGGEEREHR